MSDYDMPREGRAWLGAVERALSSIDAAQRLEIVDGLRAHILDSLDRGDAIDGILARLGTPTSIVGQTEIETARSADARSERPRPLTAKRILQIVAFGSVVAAICVIGLLPGYSGLTLDANGEIITVTTLIGFQNIANWSPIFTGSMVLALLVTAVPLFVRGVVWARMSLAAAILMFVITVTSIVLIGNWPLVPAAVASVLAAVLPSHPVHRRRPSLLSARA